MELLVAHSAFENTKLQQNELHPPDPPTNRPLVPLQPSAESTRLTCQTSWTSPVIYFCWLEQPCVVQLPASSNPPLDVIIVLKAIGTSWKGIEERWETFAVASLTYPCRHGRWNNHTADVHDVKWMCGILSTCTKMEVWGRSKLLFFSTKGIWKHSACSWNTMQVNPALLLRDPFFSTILHTFAVAHPEGLYSDAPSRVNGWNRQCHCTSPTGRWCDWKLWKWTREGGGAVPARVFTRQRVDTCHCVSIALTEECFTCGKPPYYDVCATVIFRHIYWPVSINDKDGRSHQSLVRVSSLRWLVSLVSGLWLGSIAWLR